MTGSPVPSEAVEEIAAIIAKNRAGGSVYMDGSHNPRPSERKLANEIVGIVLAAAVPVLQAQERERTAGEIERLRGDVNHLVRPIIGMARWKEEGNSEPLNLPWMIERLYLLLDVFEAAAGVDTLPQISQYGDVRETYRRNGMPQRRSFAIPEGEQE